MLTSPEGRHIVCTRGARHTMMEQGLTNRERQKHHENNLRNALHHFLEASFICIEYPQINLESQVISSCICLYKHQ